MMNIKSYYTLLSSMLSPDDIINYSLENKISYAFLIDTNMYGVMYFYKKCISLNIKPIIGLNILLDDYIIYLYAKNYTGYKSLIKLSTIQNERVVNIEDIERYNEELICVVPFNCREYFNDLSLIYSDIYLGYTNKKEEEISNNITSSIVFFRESLYLQDKDSEYLAYLYRIRDGKTISDDFSYDILGHELQIKNIFDYTSESGYNNIEKIASMCNLEFPKPELLLPIYKEGVDASLYLFELAKLGLNKRLGGNAGEEYKKRLSYELKIIDEMGFSNYFLVVYDFIRYAKKNNILVGPGRGSAAGSLVAYTLGITEIDPLKYDLLFERFLNPERKTMPDIDTDFPDDRREEVIQYVIDRYGKKNVAGIVTFGTLSSKQVLRDVARVLNIPVYKIDTLTKLIPAMSKDKLMEIYQKNLNFKAKIDSDTSFTKLFKIALKFEGFPRHTSSHAAGIVMCSKELDDVIPLTVSDSMYLTAYSMEYLEDFGLLKMDFLGLRNLSILAHILKDIEKIYNKKINFNDIDLNDSEVLKIFEFADTTGIFQFESSGMRAFLKRLKPSSFEDIFAAIALYRPSAAQNIEPYIKRKYGKEKVTYIDSSLESILRNTYGIMVYQEQVMQVANIYAGYSLGEADILRRAMSKKKMSLLADEEDKFITKSKEKGHNVESSKEIFNLVLKFALYGFNRSHSVAYSLIAYKLAYFKVYYKEVFYSNLLSNVIGYTSKMNEYIMEVRSKNIKIEKPDINISINRYVVVDGIIYAPFSIISFVGGVSTDQIIEARENGEFIDIYDAFSRLAAKGVSKRIFEFLIYAQVFRRFNYKVRTLIENLDELYNYAILAKELDPSFVMKPILEGNDEFSESYMLEKEKELFGLYLTQHPVSSYLNVNPDIIKINEIEKYQNKRIKSLIFVEKIKSIKTKRGEDMAFITGSDETGSCEFTLFPRVYKIYPIIERGMIMKIDGRVEKRFADLQIIINNLIILNGDKYE